MTKKINWRTGIAPSFKTKALAELARAKLDRGGNEFFRVIKRGNRWYIQAGRYVPLDFLA